MIIVFGVHEMHGQMHPNYCQITILLVVDLCSSLAYFMMIQPLPIAGKLPIKTLVARQLPTSVDRWILYLFKYQPIQCERENYVHNIIHFFPSLHPYTKQFYSPFSHSTLFETDERFQHLGFDIVDLGCCKCIKHPYWGPYIFVGTIFTDAPITSQVITSIMEL